MVIINKKIFVYGGPFGTLYYRAGQKLECYKTPDSMAKMSWRILWNS